VPVFALHAFDPPLSRRPPCRPTAEGGAAGKHTCCNMGLRLGQQVGWGPGAALRLAPPLLTPLSAPPPPQARTHKGISYVAGWGLYSAAGLAKDQLVRGLGAAGLGLGWGLGWGLAGAGAGPGRAET
jgi:hypothetical protein